MHTWVSMRLKAMWETLLSRLAKFGALQSREPVKELARAAMNTTNAGKYVRVRYYELSSYRAAFGSNKMHIRSILK